MSLDIRKVTKVSCCIFVVDNFNEGVSPQLEASASTEPWEAGPKTTITVSASIVCYYTNYLWI